MGARKEKGDLGRPFVAEVYEFTHFAGWSPDVFWSIAAYRNRRLLGLLGGVALLIQHTDWYAAAIQNKCLCCIEDWGYSSSSYDELMLTNECVPSNNGWVRTGRAYYENGMITAGSIINGDLVVMFRHGS